MKKLFVAAFAVSLAFASCSKNETPAETQPESNVMLEEPTVAEPVATAGTPEEEGKSLIQGADCLTCHKEDAKLIGPSYQEVAAKYEATDANIDMLADKIIEGGSGHWGDVPMTAHAGMSKENAKLMVKYILSLK
ncbi:MAG: cytochrome C [Chryseobacterium sp.]|nr:MAG: cytochrome C [Chryseobacterium sp.]